MKVNQLEGWGKEMRFTCVCLLPFIIACNLSGCKAKDDLIIFNVTEGEVIVLGASIDGCVVSDEEIVLHSSKNGYRLANVYASFYADEASVLGVFVKDHSGVFFESSCNLSKKESEHCLFKAYFNGGGQLVCVCDPYSDF